MNKQNIFKISAFFPHMKLIEQNIFNSAFPEFPFFLSYIIIKAEYSTIHCSSQFTPFS